MACYEVDPPLPVPESHPSHTLFPLPFHTQCPPPPPLTPPPTHTYQHMPSRLLVSLSLSLTHTHTHTHACMHAFTATGATHSAPPLTLHARGSSHACGPRPLKLKWRVGRWRGGGVSWGVADLLLLALAAAARAVAGV